MNKKIITNSFSETEKIGFEFSKKLEPGSIVLLYGDLGSGKTTFVKGVLKGLKYDYDVTSPTFSLINEYQADYDVIHIDCYREKNIDRWINLGINDYLNGTNIVIIEWPEVLERIIENKVLKIKINHLNEDKREIFFI
tara:strand:- start:46 stop:459 length:414 start_codon:yes stop_codon:yes gene_type:complete